MGAWSLLPHPWHLLSLWVATHPMRTEAPSIPPAPVCQGCTLTKSTFHPPEHTLAGAVTPILDLTKYLSGQNLCRGGRQSWEQVGCSQKGNPVREGQSQRPEKQCRDKEPRTGRRLHRTCGESPPDKTAGAAERTWGSAVVC